MEKIRLDLSELEVQSFSTTPVPDGRGTVHGLADTEYAQCVTGDPNYFSCVEYGCVWESGNNQSCEETCNCYSTQCEPTQGCDGRRTRGMTFLASCCM